MSDEVTQAVNDTPETTPAAPTPASGSASPDWRDVELEKTRKEAAKRRVENKKLEEQLTALTEKLSAFDTVLNKVSEMEKRLQQAEDQRKQLELQTARATAAQKYGLPAELAKRLTGDTVEALDADAKALADALPKAPNVGRFSPGNTGDAITGTNLAAAIKEKIGGGRNTPSSPFFDMNMHLEKGGGVANRED